MIFEVLYIFALFVCAVSILPLLFLALRNYGRSKRAVIEGMARLDGNLRQQIGWTQTEYIGVFDIRSPFRLGWQPWGRASQQQNLVLQRVFLQGLPDNVMASEELRRSIRRFRRYGAFFVAPLAVFILLPAYVRFGLELAGFSEIPLAICFVLLGLVVGLWVFLPLEKFRKWPEIEEPA